MGSTGISSSTSREYARIMRENNDNSPLYHEAKEYVTVSGRGLGGAEPLTAEQERILSIIDESAAKLSIDLTLYRTDDTNWLAGAKVGDVIPVHNILQASINPHTVIEENEGNVVQKLVINAPVGTQVFNPNHAYEKDLDVVRNQSYRIDRIRKDGKVTEYKVTILSNRK